MLEPSLFGSVALVMVFVTILNVFVDSGLGSALIQKKNADQLDFSTVFYFNIVMCCCLYVLIFFCTPFIAGFYGDLKLTPIIRVLSLTIVISGLKNVQQSYVSKNLLFKKLFVVNITASLVGAIVGIALAFLDYGIWAIVCQQISSMIISTIMLWLIVKWRPALKFSLRRLKALFSFGWKLLVSALIDTGYRQLNQLIIGKVYTANSLAFYNRGQTFPSVIVDNIDASINSVLFPTMSSVQDNIARVKDMTRRAIKTSVYCIAPLMMGLFFTADTVVSVILTDKWLPCVFFLRIFCITYMFYPIHTANLNAIKALGRSDFFLKLEIIKKIVGLTAILITVWISVEAMAISLLFTSVTSQIINSYPNKKLLNYSYLQQLKDILPEIFLAIFMGVCVYLIKFFPISKIIILIIQIAVGIIIYWLGSKMLKLDAYKYMIKLLERK